MTWLVLCDADDSSGLWAADQLAGLQRRPVSVLTSRDLSTAHDWTHRIRSHGVAVTFTTASGRPFSSAEIDGTLNRLHRVPMLPALTRTAPVDRRYALTEWTAFFLGWLGSLPGPVLNPTDPRGLAGAEREPREWRALAEDAGLTTTDPSLPRGDEVSLLVIDDQVVPCAPLRSPLASDAVAACLRLAARSRTPLLGLTLQGAGTTFVEATIRPDLRPGGRAAVGALAHALSRQS